MKDVDLTTKFISHIPLAKVKAGDEGVLQKSQALKQVIPLDKIPVAANEETSMDSVDGQQTVKTNKMLASFDPGRSMDL